MRAKKTVSKSSRVAPTPRDFETAIRAAMQTGRPPKGVIEVAADGSVSLDGRAVQSRAELTLEIKRLAKWNPRAPIKVQAAKGLPLRDYSWVLDLLAKAKPPSRLGKSG